MSNLSIKGKLEKLDKLNKSNPLRYMINASKNKTKFCHSFTPWSGSLAITVSKEFVSIFNKETRERNFLTFHGKGC